MRPKALMFLLILLMCGAAQAGTVNLAWDASSGADGYEIHYGLTSGRYTVALDVGPATTVAISGLDNGVTHYFAALAYNGPNPENESPYSNEVSTVPSDPPPPDTTPPTVSITSPTNGSIVPRRGTVTITASALDNVGVTTVELYIDGTLQLSDPSTPYSYQWTVPAAGGGRRYQLQAKAYDAAGNVGFSSIVEVISQ